MLRGKLILLLLVTAGVLALIPIILAGGTSKDLALDAEETLRASNEVVRAANQIDAYSLVIVAESARAATATDDAGQITMTLADAIQCPATQEELREAQREQTPQLDPETGEPVRNALGQIIDTEGQPVVEGSRTPCSQVRHQSVMPILRGWSRARQSDREANMALELSDREVGFAIPRNPDLLMVADSDGVIIARVGRDMDDYRGPDRPNLAQSFPMVARSELGETQTGLIVWRDYEGATPELAQVGVAPVMNDAGEYVGTVMVGFYLNNDSAADDRELLSTTEVAYFLGSGDNVVATSFPNDPTLLNSVTGGDYLKRASDGTVSDTAQSFGEIAAAGGGSIYEFEHDGSRYILTPTVLESDAQGNPTAGFVVLMNLSDNLSPLSRFYAVIPGVAAALFFLGLLGVLFSVNTFTEPIEEISKGVQEVIAGNKDYMWPVDEKSHLSDLSHSLNIMSARLQGKKDPDADDVEGADAWAGMVGTGSGSGGAKEAASKKPQGIGGLGQIKGRSAAKSDDSDSEEA